MIELNDNNASLLLRLIEKSAQTETLKKAVFKALGRRNTKSDGFIKVYRRRDGLADRKLSLRQQGEA